MPGHDIKSPGNWTKVVMGRYKIDGSRFLGQGSFSIVYAAEDLHTGREVSVKSYKADTSAIDVGGQTESDLPLMYEEFQNKKKEYQAGNRGLRPMLEQLRAQIQAIEARQEILFKFKRQVKVLEKIQDYGTGAAASQSFAPNASASYRVSDLKMTTRSYIDELDPGCLFVKMLDYSKDYTGEPGFLPEEEATCYIVLEMALFTLQDYLKDRAAKKSHMNIQDIHSVEEKFHKMTPKRQKSYQNSRFS